jgi:protein-disulfide isomerase
MLAWFIPVSLGPVSLGPRPRRRPGLRLTGLRPAGQPRAAFARRARAGEHARRQDEGRRRAAPERGGMEGGMNRRTMLGLAGALLPGALLSGAALAQALTEAQRAEVIEILRRALREDPSILREAFQSLERAEEEARAEAQRRAIIAHAERLFRDPEIPFKGNPQGRVVLAEFFDARCGFCKQLHPVMEQLLAAERDVRVNLFDFPILGPNSLLAARALLAAQRQERYAALHDALLRLREEPTEPVIRREAERLRLDWARLRRDMDDNAVMQRIDRNLQLARALDIQGTPAILGGTTLIPGATDLATLRQLTARLRG